MNGITINVNQLSQLNANNRMIHFHKGMVFLGKVKQIFPGDIATIQIGGKETSAKLDIGLRMDHTYWFLVEQISESGIPYITTINNKQMKDPYQQLLEKLNLSKDALSKLFIQKLSDQQLTMEYDKIPTLINLIKSTPSSSTELAINTILYMLGKHLPIEKNVFDSLMEFFISDSISDKLLLLYEQILLSSQKNPPMEKYIKWFKGLKQEGVTSLSKLLEMIGIDYETVLSKNIQSSSIQHAALQNLKQILLELRQLKNNIAIKDLAQELVNWISGQQLVNHNSQDLTPNYIFQIPIFLQEEQHDLWLKVQGYKDTDGGLSSDNSKLFLYINLTNLKDTVVELTVQKKIVSVKIYNESDITMLISLFTPSLKDKLEEIGYYLSMVKSYKKDNVQSYFFTPSYVDPSKVDKRV